MTGLSVKALAAAGGGDLTMMSVGNGMVRDGDGVLNIGTSGQVS